MGNFGENKCDNQLLQPYLRLYQNGTLRKIQADLHEC
jgi:hypothetical protein